VSSSIDVISDIILIPHKKVFVERFYNEISLSALKTASHGLWNIPGYDNSFGGIVDLRFSNIEIGLRDLPAMLAFYISHPSKTSKGKLALIADNPSSTAMSYIVKSRFSSFMNLAVYSLPENAASHVGCTLAEFDMISSDQVLRVFK